MCAEVGRPTLPNRWDQLWYVFIAKALVYKSPPFLVINQADSWVSDCLLDTRTLTLLKEHTYSAPNTSSLRLNSK